LTRALTKGLGVRVPNVTVSHGNVLRTKRRKKRKIQKKYLGTLNVTDLLSKNFSSQEIYKPQTHFKHHPEQCTWLCQEEKGKNMLLSIVFVRLIYIKK
jgi:hypothetical protein